MNHDSRHVFGIYFAGIKTINMKIDVFSTSLNGDWRDGSYVKVLQNRKGNTSLLTILSNRTISK